MKKFLYTALAVLSLLLTSLVFSSGYRNSNEIRITAPLAANPGDEILVQISINRPAWNHKAVLQQFLPEGCVATAVENGGANFSFENRTVRYEWNSSSNEQILVLAYRLRTNPDKEGLIKLNGSISFTESDQLKTINIPNQLINSTNYLEVQNLEHSVKSTQAINVNRSISSPGINPENGRRVDLRISYEKMQGKAFYFEEIPDGYTASVTAEAGAHTEMRGQTLIYSWKDAPQQVPLSISYELLPVSGRQAEFSMPYGMFMIRDADLFLASEAISGNAIVETQTGPLVKSTTIPVGIVYRIQVAATRKSPQRAPSYFYSCCQLQKDVEFSYEDGWNKYCVGRYPNYNSAKQEVAAIRHYIPDAFIVAYENGKRVSVNPPQELLSYNQ